jgi:arylsulfatase A-like enzyme
MDDCILRDPLIIGGAGLPEGRVVGDMVELIDIVPTVAELAGLELSYRQFGKSLVDAMEGEAGQHRKYAFSEGGFVREEEPVLERGPFPYDLKGLLQHEDPTLVGKAIAVRSTSFTTESRTRSSSSTCPALPTSPAWNPS